MKRTYSQDATVKTYTAQIQLRRRVPLESGTGYSTINDGYGLIDVSVMCDTQALARELGEKAFRQKSGQSTVHGGNVIVSATNFRRKP